MQQQNYTFYHNKRMQFPQTKCHGNIFRLTLAHVELVPDGRKAEILAKNPLPIDSSSVDGLITHSVVVQFTALFLQPGLSVGNLLHKLPLFKGGGEGGLRPEKSAHPLDERNQIVVIIFCICSTFSSHRPVKTTHVSEKGTKSERKHTKSSSERRTTVKWTSTTESSRTGNGKPKPKAQQDRERKTFQTLSYLRLFVPIWACKNTGTTNAKRGEPQLHSRWTEPGFPQRTPEETTSCSLMATFAVLFCLIITVPYTPPYSFGKSCLRSIFFISLLHVQTFASLPSSSVWKGEQVVKKKFPSPSPEGPGWEKNEEKRTWGIAKE